MIRSAVFRAALLSLRCSRRVVATRMVGMVLMRRFHATSFARIDAKANAANATQNSPKPASYEIAGEIERAKQTPGTEIARRGLAKRQQKAQHPFTPRESKRFPMPRSRFHLELQELKSKHRYTEMAIRYEQMRTKEGLVPDEFILGMMVHAYARLGRIEEAKKMLQDIRALGVDNRPGGPEEDWMALLLAQISASKKEDAIATFEEAQRVLPQISDRLYSTIVRGLAKLGDLETAKQYFEKAKAAKAAQLITYSAMIANYSENKDLNNALALYEELRQAKIEPSQITFVSLITAAAHVGDFARVEEIFHKHMREANIPHHYITYHAYINAYAMHNNLAKALEGIDRMKKEGLTPDDATIAQLISHFVRDEMFPQLPQLIDTLITKYSINPFSLPDAQAALLDLYGRRNDFDGVNKVFIEIAAIGARPSMHALGAFFRHAALHNKLDAMVAKLEQMKQMRLFGSTYIFNKLLDVCMQGNAPVDLVKRAIELLSSMWKLNDQHIKQRIAEVKQKYSL